MVVIVSFVCLFSDHRSRNWVFTTDSEAEDGAPDDEEDNEVDGSNVPGEKSTSDGSADENDGAEHGGLFAANLVGEDSEDELACYGTEDTAVCEEGEGETGGTVEELEDDHDEVDRKKIISVCKDSCCHQDCDGDLLSPSLPSSTSGQRR